MKNLKIVKPLSSFENLAPKRSSKKHPASLFLISQEALKSPTKGSLWQKLNSKLKPSTLFSADHGEIQKFTLDEKIIILLGLGKKENINGHTLRTALFKTASTVGNFNSIRVFPHEEDELSLRGIMDGLILGGYAWTKYKDQVSVKGHPINQINFELVTVNGKLAKKAFTTCVGTNLARDLTNDNADVITSRYMYNQVKKMVANHKEASLSLVDTAQMKKLGMNLFLGVNQASGNPAHLIIVKYHGDKSKKTFTALLGKGITFDSGGLNLKPSGGIESMRTDMGGSATIVGTMYNILSLKPKKNIIFAMAMAENCIGPKAYKSGDVLTSYSGQTVEIGNTDAEGRLVLADSMTYLQRHFKVNTIIDVATLTGAVVIALGHDHTGLMVNDQALANQLLESGAATDDRIWQLPIYDELSLHIKSDRADLKNIGLPKCAGSISAGAFLQKFLEGKTKWAHLDIAGTGFYSKEWWYLKPGATGAGVRLLTHYLTD